MAKRGNQKQTTSLLYLLLLCWLFMPQVAMANNELYLTEDEMMNAAAASLYIKDSVGFRDAPVLNTDVDIKISGMISDIQLTQTFQNNSNEWIEGVYVFPLPDKAAVRSMLIRIGDREIVGRIREKRQAEKQYEDAKAAGQVVGLVKQHRPNLFSTRFANVAPGESITIMLSYLQTARFDDNRYSLRIPTTLTPRYTNARVKDSAEITPPQSLGPTTTQSDVFNHSVSINALLIGDYSTSIINSPSHRLSVQPGNKQTDITLAEPAVLDRDFILEWTEATGAEPAIKLWREQIQDEDYLLASILPPVDMAMIPDQPRELILVIDTSGSMAGASIEAARSALLDALDDLDSTDQFNIIEFNSQHQSLFNSPVAATEENLATARRFTKRLIADGGTEMMGALREALANTPSNHLRQVVFITDGSVGYEEAVMDSIKRRLGDTRLFTVGIGTAPNQWFMRKVAQAGRGTYQLISDVNEVEAVMSVLLKKLASPALTNIQITVEGGHAEFVPDPVADLYAKEPLVVAAKLEGEPQTMIVSGTWGQQPWQTAVSILGAPEADTGLSTVWAKQKIENLLDKQREHSDPDYYRSLILRLALDHQLLSPYTAFLAIEDTPVRPVEDALVSKEIPNLLPAGSQMHAINFPQGAAGIDTLLLFGFFSALLAMFCGFGLAVKRTVVS